MYQLLNLVGPLPLSQQCMRLLMVINRSTRWLEVFPLEDILVANCDATLLTGWISKYGIPTNITSDQGTQLVTALWTNLAAQLWISLHARTAYHPLSNGMVERFN